MRYGTTAANQNAWGQSMPLLLGPEQGPELLLAIIVFLILRFNDCSLEEVSKGSCVVEDVAELEVADTRGPEGDTS